MNKKTFFVIAAIFIISLGIATMFFVFQKKQIHKNNEDISKQVIDKEIFEQQIEQGTENKKMEFVYEPKPIELPLVPAPHGSFKTYTSPDGNYIAWSYSNEGGDSGIYITDLEENKLSNVYCGFFRSWSEDSEQIEVYVPIECGLPSEASSVSFYLTTKGDTIVNE